MSVNANDSAARAAFTARTTYDERAVTAFCKAQFSAFQKKKVIIILVASLAMILVGISGVISTAAGTVLLILGCCALMYISYIPKTTAESIIKALDGKYNASFYRFDEGGFDIRAGKDENRLGYDNMIRLIEDKDFYMFFATPMVAYMVDKNRLRPDDAAAFQKYTADRVGLQWTKARPWYSVSVRSIMHERKNTRKIPGN